MRPESNPIAASALGVVKIYWTETGEVHALKGVDALFSAGQVTALVGPSGSGKSSLMRILCGLDRPTAGAIVVGDTEVSALRGARLHRFRRDNMGYVFQRRSDNLISYLTAREHLEHSARLKGLSETSKVDQLLDQLGLRKRDHHRPDQLSGGEQQRLAFAQAVIGDPVLVVADEPTAELDSGSSHALLETVLDLAHRGIGVVVSTHDPAVVEVAERTIYLRHGAVEAETTEARNLSVIDAAGRIQLPPEFLKLFPRPSGSGKTTLLNLIVGWEEPDSGSIEWSGQYVPAADRMWGDLAIVPQRLGLIEELSVAENIQLPGRLGERPPIEGRAEELMDSLGLSQFADRMPTEISLGEQQRTGLARALVSGPRLLLADEPTGHQDAVWGRGVLRTLRRACEQGTTCLVATHNEEILKYVDWILAIRDGEVHEEQPSESRTEDAH